MLLIDASNAFNRINRAVALLNTFIKFPAIATDLTNTYRHPSRLFIAGGGEIYSQEGTTQGDPMAMPWYSINTTIIIEKLRNEIVAVKQIWLADDASAGGKLLDLYKWYKLIISEGEKHGYFVNKGKCWLIVKNKAAEERAKKSLEHQLISQQKVSAT